MKISLKSLAILVLFVVTASASASHKKDQKTGAETQQTLRRGYAQTAAANPEARQHLNPAYRPQPLAKPVDPIYTITHHRGSPFERVEIVTKEQFEANLAKKELLKAKRQADRAKAESAAAAAAEVRAAQLQAYQATAQAQEAQLQAELSRIQTAKLLNAAKRKPAQANAKALDRSTHVKSAHEAATMPILKRAIPLKQPISAQSATAPLPQQNAHVPVASAAPKLDYAKKAPAVETRECPVCLDNKPLKDFVMLTCNHNTTCSACLEIVLDNALKAKNSKNFKCPAEKCNAELLLEDVKAVAKDKKKLNEYSEVRLAEYLSLDPLNRQCPTPNCSYAYSIPSLNERDRQTVDCPQCKKSYCSLCTLPHSKGISCQAAKKNYQDSSDKGKAEKESEELIKKTSKACPGCKMSIEKNEGCNHMTCRQCKYEFNWCCLSKFDPNQFPAHQCASNAAGQIAPAQAVAPVNNAGAQEAQAHDLFREIYDQLPNYPENERERMRQLYILGTGIGRMNDLGIFITEFTRELTAPEALLITIAIAAFRAQGMGDSLIAASFLHSRGNRILENI